MYIKPYFIIQKSYIMQLPSDNKEILEDKYRGNNNSIALLLHKVCLKIYEYIVVSLH